MGQLFGLSLVFLLPLESIFLDEHASFFGLFGIFSIVFGAFLLSWVDKGNIFDVFKRIVREKGAVYMLIAAMGAASSVTIIKGAYLGNIHPLNFGFWIMLGLLILYVLFALFKRISFGNISKRTFYIACFFSAGACLHYVGLNMILASYYIALKRSSMIFDVIVGKTFGNEENFKRKILAAFIIFFGIILITLF